MEPSVWTSFMLSCDSMTPCPRQFEGRRHLGMKSGTAKTMRDREEILPALPINPSTASSFVPSERKQSGLENRPGLALWGKTSESPHPARSHQRLFSWVTFPYGSVSILVGEQRRFWSSTCRMTSFPALWLCKHLRALCRPSTTYGISLIAHLGSHGSQFDTFCIASFRFVQFSIFDC